VPAIGGYGIPLKKDASHPHCMRFNQALSRPGLFETSNTSNVPSTVHGGARLTNCRYIDDVTSNVPSTVHVCLNHCIRDAPLVRAPQFG
jgi:hypothetical protein